MTIPQPQTPLFATVLRWVALMVVSATLSLYMESLAIPASYMLGAMITAVIFAVCNQSVPLPKSLFYSGQGVVGAMIAGTIPVAVFHQLAGNWPLFLGGICSVSIISILLGLFLAKTHVLPGTTGIWGTSPGAATAMTIMAEQYHADVRLVAVMQYLRVVLVAVSAIAVTHYVTGNSGQGATAIHQTLDWHITDYPGFTLTVLLIVVGTLGGIRLPIGAGPMLLTLFLGLIVSDIHWVHITLPQPFLLISYMIIGWNIGFRFTRQSIRYAFRLLPQIVLSILFMIGSCALISHLLVMMLGIDPLTAYLAMSPGGADSIAIIAASSTHVDMSFIMTMQTGRFILVLLSGPPIARWLASRQSRQQSVS